MALQCGTKAELKRTQPKNNNQQDSQGQSALHDAKPEILASGMFQGLGFFALTGSALAIMAGLVLLHPYAKFLQVQYNRDCYGIRIEESRATVTAMDRLLAAGPTDEVLTKRLAWSRLGMHPNNELVPPNQSTHDISPAGTLSNIHYEDPPEPDPWISSLALKLQKPSRRRGLVVMTGCLVLSAMLLFRTPHLRKKEA